VKISPISRGHEIEMFHTVSVSKSLGSSGRSQRVWRPPVGDTSCPATSRPCVLG
jgi:hypothetical protein